MPRICNHPKHRKEALFLHDQFHPAFLNSFRRCGHTLQQPALEIWRGNDVNAMAAQQALRHRAMCNAAARRGMYNTLTEKDR